MTPPSKKKMRFRFGQVSVRRLITQTLHTSNNFLYLWQMSQYVISLENRVSIGFSLGWAWYEPDEDFDYGEFILYLGLISLNIKYS